MVRVQVRLPETQIARLREAAHTRRTSVSELIREAVSAALRDDDTVSEDEKWRRASALVGKYRSKEGDMSRRHDEIIAEAAMEQ